MTTTPNISCPTNRQPRSLTTEEIFLLESRGCTASDWSAVSITDGSDFRLLRDIDFEGTVKLGLIERHSENARKDCMIRTALLRDCSIGDYPRIRHVPGGIENMLVGSNVTIENVGRIRCEPDAPCGIGTRVSALDETGSRNILIYPGLSAQSAILMARAPRSRAEEIYAQTEESALGSSVDPAYIGDGAIITDTGSLLNVSVGREVRVEGASRLSNGTIINNAFHDKALAYVGAGVDADGFIIEDGIVDSGVILRNVYVGQGARLEKNFTAHDSLFFANCTLENGEACALFAGPYTVSMHKGSLLIGCPTSFMNAGSSTNQSNHMYKLGPVHWGVLERGVKTSSNSYLMLGANIGAFSMLMGDHKTHPDSREFPFSYLFGDPTGATVVVPAVMLRSCGLMRDEKKWPSRDRRRRRGLPLRDRVIFNVLNPTTVDAMLRAIPIIRELTLRPADDDRFIRYKGMKLSKASLERAIKLYWLGIMKYLDMTLLEEITPDADEEAQWHFPDAPADEAERNRDAGPWVDVAGQPMPREILDEAISAESVEAREKIFDKAFDDYRSLQLKWITARIPDEMRVDARSIRMGAAEFDRLVDTDRENYRAKLSAELGMLSL